MPLVLGIDDVKPDQIRNRRPKPDGSNSSGSHTGFFKSTAEEPDDPAAFLVQFGPGGSLSSHYHTVDQFQVLVNGEGDFGRHRVSPYVVHFSRAYTPYGPLLSKGGWGFLTLRTHYDPGSARDFEKLKQMPGRQPWQVSSKIAFPSAAAAPVVQPIPEIKDEQGLFACTVTVPPHALWTAPDAAGGNGQYIVATKGSFMHGGREHKALAVVFVQPTEAAFQAQAGAQGFEAMVLNFPRTAGRSAHLQAPSAASGYKKWQCVLCAFAYDEAKGMPDEGIAPGTRWADVPEAWSCPDCAARKSDFEMAEVHA